MQGLAKQVLAVPQQAASAVGLTDLAFFGGGGGSSGGGGGYVVLASGMGGQVFLWDTRAKAAPSATLQAAQCGAMYAVQLVPDQQVVLAGTQSGEVKLWDLRWVVVKPCAHSNCCRRPRPLRQGCASSSVGPACWYVHCWSRCRRPAAGAAAPARCGLAAACTTTRCWRPSTSATR